MVKLSVVTMTMLCVSSIIIIWFDGTTQFSRYCGAEKFSVHKKFAESFCQNKNIKKLLIILLVSF